MTIKDYANDVGRTVEEIKALCDSLDIKYEDENTPLDDMDIVVLDNNLPEDEEDTTSNDVVEDYDYINEEEVEDKAEELAQNTKFDLDNTKKIEKVKKKQTNKENKKEFLSDVIPFSRSEQPEAERRCILLFALHVLGQKSIKRHSCRPALVSALWQFVLPAAFPIQSGSNLSMSRPCRWCDAQTVYAGR